VSGNAAGYADGVGTAAVFNNPSGLAIGPGHVIYVADIYNNDIRKIMPDGTVTLVAGSTAQAPGYMDGTGTAVRFNLPANMYIDDNGIGYISEIGGNRVRKIMLTGYTINGTLPPGLTFDSTTGNISGTVTGPFATQTDTVSAYNGAGHSSTIITFSYYVPSTIATLSNLVPGSGTLTPVFASASTNYSVNVANATSGITLTPTATDSTATIRVNGVSVTSGTASGSIPLAVGANTITTVVTAQDGITTDTYTVTVTRALSSDATLSNLTTNQCAFVPSFSSGTIAYTDSVSNSVTSITVTPTAHNSNATVKVNGTLVTSGTASAAIPLMAGNNIINIVVTAPDGVTTNTYTLTVYRGDPAANVSASNILTPNGDGKNDYWIIQDIQLYPKNMVHIFDQSGRLVYSARGYNNDWNGTSSKGSLLPQGTYYYMVHLGPSLPILRGTVNIIRN
jgi:gliding motility-associated-like protein